MRWWWSRKGTDGGDVSPKETVSVSDFAEQLLKLLPQLASPRARPDSQPSTPDSEQVQQAAQSLEQLRKQLHAAEQRLSRVVQYLKSQGLQVPGRWPSEPSEAEADSLEPTSALSERPRVVAGRSYRSENGSH